MHLRQLEMLMAVADRGGYTKAEAHLHISHSAIHRQIRLLEDELQSRIFVRTGRHVHLTETGELLVQTARQIAQELAIVQRQIKERNDLKAGHLRIGTGTTVLLYFLPPVLERFRQCYPGIDLSLITGPFDNVASRILADELDLGIGYLPAEMLADEPKLAFETLYKEEFVLTVHRSHPLAKQQTVSLAKAVEFPLILFPATSRLRRMHERLFLDLGLKPRIVMQLENEEAIAEMIGLNMGIAFLSLRRAEQSGLHFLRIARTPIHCEVGMIFRRGGYMPKAVSEFVRMCREAHRGGKAPAALRE